MDTGADDTLFPLSVATRLGIDLRSAPSGKAHGVGGGSFDVSYAEVQVQITDDNQAVAEWSATVAFTQQTLDFGLLGFAGCLEFFRSSFDGENEFATLDPNVNFYQIAQGSIWTPNPP